MQVTQLNGARRVLLVDDQAHVVRVFKLSLEGHGFEVSSALNGEIALRLMHREKYDVLISEHDLPQMNGEQLCKLVYKQFKSRSPLMFLVNEPESAPVKHQGDKSLCVEYLAKPISMSLLIARLTDYFDNFEKAVSA